MLLAIHFPCAWFLLVLRHQTTTLSKEYFSLFIFEADKHSSRLHFPANPLNWILFSFVLCLWRSAVSISGNMNNYFHFFLSMPWNIEIIFFKGQVDGDVACSLGFIFTPNGKAQRAGKRGAGFAFFAKPATLLTVRLERFVGCFCLRLRFIFTPTHKICNTHNGLFWCFLRVASATHIARQKAGNANIALPR